MWLVGTRRWSVAEVVGSVLFFAASLMPSLLPRPWFVQGFVSGLAVAIGHGVGSAIGRLARQGTHRRDRLWVQTPVMVVLLVALSLVVVGALVWHWLWQADIRSLMGIEGSVTAYLAGVLGTTVLAGYLLLGIGRAVHRGAGAYRRLLARVIPRPLATALVVLTAVVVTVVGFDVVIADRLLVALDRAYLTATLRYEEDVARPDSPFRSGGPGSLIAWESMGSQGRAFVAQGPDDEEIATFTREPTETPIRVYAGLGSGETTGERVQAAVAELERTGAFRRDLLVLVAPTGTGWVDPHAIDPLEYMYKGKTAAVAVQYSYRPSWLVMIGNQDVAIEASAALLDAVSRRLEGIAEDNRPRLLLYGESLGSFGWEALFEDLHEVRRRTDGVLWVGPPSSNRLWSRLVAGRDPGSPVWQPTFEDGLAVRFGADGEALSQLGGEWSEPRVVYLQHASDPISWLNFDVLVHKPTWLEEPRGPDVSRLMPYIPFVTFWQMVVDLVMGTNAPSGHGHKFGLAQAEAWALIIPPEGWDDSATERLLDGMGEPE